MVSIVADARDLPPDMVLLPGGQEMKLSDFWKQHGDDLRPYLNARIAVATPGLRIPDDADSAMEATVGVVVGLIVGVILRNSPKTAATVSPVVGDYIAKDVTAWVKHHLEHGRIVRVYTLHEVFPQIRAE